MSITSRSENLFETMHSHLGISGAALGWFSSYISDRTQRVRKASEERPVRYGVPQGSVLGPLLLTVYTAPLQGLLTMHFVDYHKFADDLQIYTCYIVVAHLLGDLECAVQRLSDCIGEIQCWMIKHKLKLNDSKTELMVASAPII